MLPTLISKRARRRGSFRARKYLPGAFRGLKRHVVLTSENHRLDRAAQSYRSFVPIAQRFVKAKRLLMVLDGGAIIARGIQSVGFCSQGKRQSFFATQALGDKDGGLSQVKCLLVLTRTFWTTSCANCSTNLLADQRFVFRLKLLGLYAEVAAELGLAVGSIGFTRQKCLERLRRNSRNWDSSMPATLKKNQSTC